VDDPSAWYTEDVQRSKEWMYRLTEEDISEIDAALRLVSALEVRREVIASSIYARTEARGNVHGHSMTCSLRLLMILKR